MGEGGHLLLFELAGLAQHVFGQVVDARLDLAARGLGHAVHVGALDAPRAEEPAVREVLPPPRSKSTPGAFTRAQGGGGGGG